MFLRCSSWLWCARSSKVCESITNCFRLVIVILGSMLTMMKSCACWLTVLEVFCSTSRRLFWLCVRRHCVFCAWCLMICMSCMWSFVCSRF